MTWKVSMVFINEKKNYQLWAKIRITVQKTEIISWRHGPHEQEHWHRWIACQDDAPASESHRTCVALSTKIKMASLWIWLSHIGNILFLTPVFNYVYFKIRVANFVEICNINTNEMVITVVVSIINSDKLSRSYDDLYFGRHVLIWAQSRLVWHTCIYTGQTNNTCSYVYSYFFLFSLFDILYILSLFHKTVSVKHKPKVFLL